LLWVGLKASSPLGRETGAAAGAAATGAGAAAGAAAASVSPVSVFEAEAETASVLPVAPSFAFKSSKSPLPRRVATIDSWVPRSKQHTWPLRALGYESGPQTVKRLASVASLLPPCPPVG
jgi:hypothetical protein